MNSQNWSNKNTISEMKKTSRADSSQLFCTEQAVTCISQTWYDVAFSLSFHPKLLCKYQCLDVHLEELLHLLELKQEQQI